MKVLSAPIDIYLAVTNQCNLHCRHCFSLSGKNNEDLSTGKLLAVVRQIIKLKVLRIAIAGGEPLMRKDFFRVLKALGRSKSIITLNTNATLITESAAKRLSEFPVKAYVVSLDGSCPRIHDKLRGRSSFNKAVKGINNLLKYKLPVIISTTVTRINCKDLNDIAKLGKRLGVNAVRFNRIVYAGRALCYDKKFIMDKSQRAQALKTAKRLKKIFGNFVTGSLFQVGCGPKKNEKGRFLLENGCGAGANKCAIRHDGLVTPCSILWDIKAGDLRKSDLSWIWRNSPIMKKFRAPAGQELLKKIYCWNEDFTKDLGTAPYLGRCP